MARINARKLNLNSNIDQVPLQTGFSYLTSAKEIVKHTDLRGKTAMVTGGYSGIGLETVKALASAGATVFVPARNPENVREKIKAIPNTILEEIDLLEPDSVDSFAKRFLELQRPLHILINNAGIMGPPLTRDRNGNEVHFVVNHLSHFQLTARLWPALKLAANARVINVSSRAHKQGGVIFDDPAFERTRYTNWKAYAQSKTANTLFAVELDRLGKSYGVRAYAVHPGLIPASGISRYIVNQRISSAFIKGFIRSFLSVSDILHLTGLVNLFIRYPSNRYKTNAQGAATIVWCATSPLLKDKGGVYCEDCDIAEAVSAESTTPYGVRPWAINAAYAGRLWELSEKLTGLKFPL